MRGRWASLRQRIGYRGDSLLFFAFVDFVVVWTLLRGDTSTATYRWMATLAPLQVWAAGWLAVGLICAYHAFHRNDHFGYVAAIGIKLLTGGWIVIGWITSDVTPVAAVLWFGLAFFAWRLSGWEEPERRDDEDGDS